MKLFDFQQLKVIKVNRKDKNRFLHRVVIPKGYNDMPFLQYVKQTQSFITNYIKSIINMYPDQPFYLQAIVDESISKTDLQFIYSAIETAFAQGLILREKNPEEYRLGVPLESKYLNMTYMNIKKLINSRLSVYKASFEVRTQNNILSKKLRLVKK